jgi:hypothetical protein
LKSYNLPKEFGFYSFDCDCPYPIEAVGRTDGGGVWTSTELITAKNTQQGKEERKEQFKARLNWLQSATNNS